MTILEFTAEDETSSRHRPLPTPNDPVLPSPLRFPLPTSIGESALLWCKRKRCKT